VFHGQPYCGVCGYEGPDFMWMWHHWWGLGVLAQDRETFDLRVIEVPDDEVFYHRDGRTQSEVARESEAYITAVVAQQLRPTERRVAPSEFVDLSTEDGGPSATELPCPKCRALLLWRHTGIS
jgi:hypothetical protein